MVTECIDIPDICLHNSTHPFATVFTVLSACQIFNIIITTIETL